MFPAVHGIAASLGGGANPWYLAGGAPMPVAVYEPGAAASLAASYVPTIATLGNVTLDPAVVGGVAPTHSAATGWGFNGATQYLKTGISAGTGFSLVVVYSNAVGNGSPAGHQVVAGTRWNIRPNTSLSRIEYRFSETVNAVVSGADAGVVAMAGTSGYWNGSDVATLNNGTSLLNLVLIGNSASNSSGNPGAFWFTGNIQYIAIWDTSTGHATWMPAVSAAVAAL